MSALIYFPKFGRPSESPAPILLEPLIPSLVTMVITLSRNHMYAMDWRERIIVARAKV